MTDYYLKFDEKPELADELVSNEEVNVDVIGEITIPAKYDEEDNEIESAIVIQGWHVNLRINGELPEQLKQFEVFPRKPVRVWLQTNA